MKVWGIVNLYTCKLRLQVNRSLVWLENLVNKIHIKHIILVFLFSKICSGCGNKKKNLKLSERIYRCESCGLEIDRDYNASLNLSKYK